MFHINSSARNNLNNGIMHNFSDFFLFIYTHATDDLF